MRIQTIYQYIIYIKIMPEISRLHIQFLRSESAIEYDGPNLLDGEPAVGMAPGHEKIFLKNSQGEIARFASDSALNSLRQAVGIETENDSFVYRTQVPYLSGNTNMSDALDLVAARVNYSTPSVETGFEIEMVTTTNNDTITTTPQYSFGIECPVSDVTVTKVIDGTPTVLYSGSSQNYTGSTTIESIEEKYILEFIPSGVTDVKIQEVLYVYLCCTTANDSPTLSGDVVSDLNFILTTNKEIETEITTASGDYMWFIIPSTLEIEAITNDNVEVVVDYSNPSVLEATVGSLTCYRTVNQLGANTWKPTITLKGLKKSEKRIVNVG